MKKILAVFLSVTLIAALFCVATSAEADPNTWLCEESASGGYSTGWWIGPATGVNDGNIVVTFSTPNAFDGFVMACYASGNPSPAVLNVRLLDEDDNKLEEQEITVAGDHENSANGYVEVYFDNAYPAGVYSIEFEFAGGEHFVLGTGGACDAEVSVSGTCNTSQGAVYPAIVLYGAEAPVEEETTEEEEVTTEEEEVTTEEEEVTTEEEEVTTDGEPEETERELAEIEDGILNIVIGGGVEKVEAKAGEEVDVKIELKGVTTLSSLKITLTYDEHLSVALKGNGKEKVSFEMQVQYPEDATVMSAANNYPDDHKLILNWQALDDEINADSVFATITFVVAEDAEGFLPITGQVNANDVFNYDHENDDDMVNVDFNLIDGGVETVESALPLVLTVHGSAAPCRPRNAKLVMKYKRALAPMELEKDTTYADLPYADQYEKKPYLKIGQLSCADVNADLSQCGLAGSPTKVKNVENIVFKAKESKVLTSSDADMNGLIQELLANHTIG